MSVFTQFDSNYSDGFYSSMPGADGGTDVLHNGVIEHHGPFQEVAFEDGHMVIKSVNHQTGAVKTFVDGQLKNTCVQNVFGGETNIAPNNYVVNTTIPDATGGEAIYDGNMHFIGHTIPNIYGMEDYLSMHGNATDILHYNDPLAHSNEYISNPFDIAGGRHNG